MRPLLLLSLPFALLAAGCCTAKHRAQSPARPETPRLAQLDAAIKNDGASARLLSQRAFTLAMLGRGDESRAEFARALSVAGEDRDAKGQLLWNRGWAEFNLGDGAAALSSWEQSIALLDEPAWWVPHTLALGYWSVGRRDEALARYDEAAKAYPGRFGTWKALVGYTDFWTWEEKQTIYRIYDAWSRAYVAKKP